MGFAQDLCEITQAMWSSSSTRPSEQVLEQLRSAAKRGFAWCIVPDEQLTSDNLRWLSLEGFRLQKLTPRDEQVLSWRITWLVLPKGVDAENTGS